MSLQTALLLLVAALCMWIPDYVRTPGLWSAVLTTQLLAALNGILLCMVLYRAKATAHFSLLPAVLYVAATGILPLLRVHWQPQTVAAILLFFLYATRNMTDSHEPNDLVFFVTVMLCAAALFMPDALWCIGFLWVVVLLQGSFTLRTVCASVLGAALVIIYYVLAMYIGRAEPWDYSQLFARHWFGFELPMFETLAIGAMMAGFLTVAGGAFRRSSHDLVSTRMLLYHVVLLGLLSALLIMWTTAQPYCQVLLTLALSATAGIYLLQKESESRGITLSVYLIGAATLYLWLILTL